MVGAGVDAVLMLHDRYIEVIKRLSRSAFGTGHVGTQ
jgi:hypothetical protein